MPGPPMGGGGPAAGTIACDANTPWLTPPVSDVASSDGDSNIPTGEVPGVPPGVPAAEEPPVEEEEAAAGPVESPSLLSSERM